MKPIPSNPKAARRPASIASCALALASLCAIALLPGAPASAQEPAAAAPAPAQAPAPAPAPANLHDPFFGGGGDYERVARRKLAQAALNRCRILARGSASQGSAAVLIALEEGRHSLLRVGDLLTLETEGDLIDFELVAVTRQVVRFQLEDGSQLLLR